MDEPMEVDLALQQPVFETLYLLKLIKDKQQTHGLRHSDYKRYSDYCNKRIRRLRKSLKFTNQHKCVPKHRAKFQSKKVTLEVMTESRFLELLIFQIEHCWARGMEFKFASEDEVHARQKFHASTRLAKALQLARNLETIARTLPSIDSLTKLEIQAYFNYISAVFFLEKKQWREALENYRQAKVIYEKLGKVVKDAYLVSLYDSRCRELASMIKVCEYNCGSDVSVATLDIKELNLDENNVGIEKLILDAKAALSTKAVSPPKKVEKKEVKPTVGKKKKRKSRKVPDMSKFIPTKPMFFDLTLEYIKLPEQVVTMK